MPFPKPEIEKLLEKSVTDYKAGRITDSDLKKWQDENKKPYDHWFAQYVSLKCQPIKGHEHINRFDCLNFFYKINKMMGAGLMAEYDNIGLIFRSDKMFETHRQMSEVCLEKSRLMEKGIFNKGEIEYLQGLPDWVDAGQEEYEKLYYKASYFKKQIKTVEDFLWANWQNG